jgi:AraC-like DNA-binding protein
LVKKDGDFKKMPEFGTRNTIGKPSEVTTEGDFFNVSVRLVIPNGLSLFTKIPMNLIYENDAFSLTDIFDHSEIQCIAEQLSNAKWDIERVNIVESFLLSKIINPASQVFICITDTIHDLKGFTTVSELAQKFKISERTIHRYFNKYVGVNPNEYINLTRFRSVIHLTNTSQNSLLSHALEVGYYDQSHFIKHFKEFSTVTPKQFFDLKHSNSLSDFYNI